MSQPGLKEFAEYQKYSYREVSQPNQTFTQKLKNFKKIFFKSTYRTVYFKETKELISNAKVPLKDRNILKTNNKLYNIGEIGIGAYILLTFRWHYKNGYFHNTNNIIHFYIITKIISCVALMQFSLYFLYKELSDPVMYSYFSKKEEEWDKEIENKRSQLAYTRDYLEERGRLRTLDSDK
jgi:hypothetical protein